ncbi:SMP-30/gluconolactonase/LRE family protein [Micromonospora sp. NBC_01813]|uniref:SMP-30/gluconolactonase/LRE family protein n=1 Tax=Micromonospora sp. NBC_01813 TaxID=2975988 RepID=UPI002DDAD494|nr:superoxide dismutase [Micromonospora sp. NBC_01813]WSA10933.1 SMP-30/gluconolactonase/LRE family protein [Micromonospora sp. NBC_01813]
MADRRRTTIGATVSAAAVVGALALATGLAAAGQADPDEAGADTPGAAPTTPLVDTVRLPDGFQPEGIAIDRDDKTAFFGSLADGSIFRADLVTGAGEVIGAAPGTPSVGMALDGQGRLFVAGGSAGDARVIDPDTGDLLASYDLAAEPASFVNDVTVTETGAFFTDSTNPVVYHLPFDASGELPAPAQVRRIPLTGDIVYGDGINANGIIASPSGTNLIIVQSNTGLLFTVDPTTGVTDRTGIVDVNGDGLLIGGDGLLVLGLSLLVVQNRANTVVELQINAAGSQGDIVDRITDERFDVPTTIADAGDLLYLPNARFGIEVTPDTEYEAVAIDRP